MFNVQEYLREPAGEDVLCRNCGHTFSEHDSDGLTCLAEAEDDSGDLCTCTYFDPWDSQPAEILLPDNATLEELIAIRKVATQDGRMAPTGLGLQIQSMREAEIQKLGLAKLEASDAEVLRLLNDKHYEDALFLLETCRENDKAVAQRTWQCYMGLDRPKEAVAALLKVPDKDAVLFELMARSHIQLEDWEPAAACARTSFDLAPSAAALALLAEATIAGRERDEWSEELQSEVWSLLRRAIEFPDRSEWTYLLLLEAAPDGEGSTEQNDLILALLRQATAALPTAWELRERLAFRLDLSTAAEEIVAVLASIPAADLSVSAGVRACDAYSTLGRVSEAIEQLDSHSRVLNRFNEAQFVKAGVYYRNGLPDDALGALTAIRSDVSPTVGFHAAIMASVIAFGRGQVGDGVSRFGNACSLFFEEPSISRHHLDYLILLGERRQTFLSEACGAAAAHIGVKPPTPIIHAALEYFRYVLEPPSERKVKRLFNAYSLYAHPKLQEDLATAYEEMGDIESSVCHHLESALWTVSKTNGDEVVGYYYASTNISKQVSLAAHYKAMAIFKQNRSNQRALVRVFWPFYHSFLRDAHWAAKRYKTIIDTLNALGLAKYGRDSDYWDYAYAAYSVHDFSLAETTYREYLRRVPDSPAALHNCALALRQLGRLEEALALSSRAVELSDDEKHARVHDELKAAVFALQADRATAQASADRESAKRDDLLKTAPERWPQLDRYKRQLLSVLSVIRGFGNWSELANLCGIGEQYIQGHWRRLVEWGMIIENADTGFEINRYLQPLIERERSHAIAIKLIHAEPRIAFKPIFNSQLEYTVYSVLVRLFPNQLVFPNMGLQGLFQYDRMKEHLDADEFGYYLRAQVDFCITSTASYLPILGVEVDSDYHDQEAQQVRDAMKDRIFQAGGVPLLRLRPFGRPTEGGIREQLCEDLRRFGNHLRQTDRQAGLHVSPLLEIDFSAFGLEP